MTRWFEPTIDSEEERQAAERARQMYVSACWVRTLVCHMITNYSERSENNIWRKLLRPRRQGIKREWRKVHNAELNDL
jgi:hypothetical protein